MILYPDFYCKNIKDVDIEKLKENNIKGIILDVDNTLIDYDVVEIINNKKRVSATGEIKVFVYLHFEALKSG